MGLNESLLAMRSNATYHHLYTISVMFCVINSMPNVVPNPQKVYDCLTNNGMLDEIVEMAGNCLNIAFENASASVKENKVFSPQNWIKAKASLEKINDAVRTQLNAIKMLPIGKETYEKMKKNMTLSRDDFEDRWTAD